MEPTVVRVVVNKADYDRVVGELWLLGPSAVAEDARGEAIQLTAGYSTARDAAATVAQLSSDVPELISVAQKSWTAAWRAHAVPYQAGPWWVRLPQHPHSHASRIDLVIEPGAAFGFSHVSTRLALELLSSRLPPSADVADVGSGTGILAIGTALLGAHRVHAVDIDPVAVAITAENARRNHSGVDVNLGSVTALPLPAYHLMLANMTAATLVGVRDDLADKLASGGELLLSGFLETQRSDVLEAFAPLLPAAAATNDGWAAVALRRD